MSLSSCLDYYSVVVAFVVVVVVESFQDLNVSMMIAVLQENDLASVSNATVRIQLSSLPEDCLVMFRDCSTIQKMMLLLFAAVSNSDSDCAEFPEPMMSNEFCGARRFEPRWQEQRSRASTRAMRMADDDDFDCDEDGSGKIVAVVVVAVDTTLKKQMNVLIRVDLVVVVAGEQELQLLLVGHSLSRETRRLQRDHPLLHSDHCYCCC